MKKLMLIAVFLACLYISCNAAGKERWLKDVMFGKGYQVADKYMTCDMCRRRLCYAKRYIQELKLNLTASQPTPATFASCTKLCSDTYGSLTNNIYNYGNLYLYASPESEKKTWADAKAFCESKGMALTVLPTQDDIDNFLIILFYGELNDIFYYIGLTDSATEGTFVWNDGSTMTHSSFASATGNSEANDCVTASYVGAAAYEIKPCDSAFRFTCTVNPLCTGVLEGINEIVVP